MFDLFVISLYRHICMNWNSIFYNSEKLIVLGQNLCICNIVVS